MENLSATNRNIQEICAIEKHTLSSRSASERLGDLISTQAGRMWFIIVHFIWFALWVAFNLTGRRTFDPFPFALLTMLVSLESIFLSSFILMSQNRATKQADQRAHLDLQINLLAEHENSKMLLMLQALCKHHQLIEANDPEVNELAKRTEPQELLKELVENLPAPDNPPHS
jgi:uncharacterized membrane protein